MKIAKMTRTISGLRDVYRQKGFQAASMLIFNSLSWYFPLFILFSNAINQLNVGNSQIILIFGFHYLAILFSALLGNNLVEKIGRNKLLSIWVLLGACATALMLLISSSGVPVIYAISVLLGLSLGLGFPSCLAYFGDNSATEKRGLIGGITFALTFVAIMVGGLLSTMTTLAISIIGFSLWRLIGLVFVPLSRQEQTISQTTHSQTKVPYLEIIKERSFLLYLVPWIIFCIINFFQAPFFDSQLETKWLGTDLSYMISLGEFGIGAISMLVGGYLSDRIGRKRVIIAAFAMVGVGYALLTFASSYEIVFYSYVVLDGIAWGIFFSMFTLVIWQDLAQSRVKNRYFLIGNMPFILSSYITPIVRPYISSGDKPIIPIYTAFSFASFFLFMAVIPLMVAPETLSEKVIKDQDLKGYAEKAFKQAMKETKKAQKKNPHEPDNKNEQPQEETEESPKDKKARELAEKYY